MVVVVVVVGGRWRESVRVCQCVCVANVHVISEGVGCIHRAGFVWQVTPDV